MPKSQRTEGFIVHNSKIEMTSFHKFLLVSVVSISFFMLAPQASAATIARPMQSLGLVE